MHLPLLAIAHLYLQGQQHEDGIDVNTYNISAYNMVGIPIGRFMMKKIELDATREFTKGGMKRFFLVQDSEYFKIINFNLSAGHTFPVHSHDLDGHLSIQVIEGTGEFLGADNSAIPAKTGDILISEIREPHGVRAESDMRILVTITPPI